MSTPPTPQLGYGTFTFTATFLTDGAAAVMRSTVVQWRRAMSPSTAERPAHFTDAALHQGSTAAQ